MLLFTTGAVFLSSDAILVLSKITHLISFKFFELFTNTKLKNLFSRILFYGVSYQLNNGFFFFISLHMKFLRWMWDSLVGLFLELFYLYRDYRRRKKFWNYVALKHQQFPRQVYTSPKDNFLIILYIIYAATRYFLTFLFLSIVGFIRRQFPRWWR